MLSYHSFNKVNEVQVFLLVIQELFRKSCFMSASEKNVIKMSIDLHSYHLVHIQDDLTSNESF